MKYIEDKEFKYKNLLNKYLGEYNYKFTGDKESSVGYVYALKDNKLVGGAYAYLDWDWVDIDSVYYDSIDTLKKIILALKHYYCDKAVGFKLLSEVDCLVNDFKSVGFRVVGKLDDTPKVKGSYNLADDNMHVEDNEQQDVIVTTEMIKEYDEILQKQQERFNKENNISDYEPKAMMFVALDDDDSFVGGIRVSVTDDLMYGNQLVVNEKYRGMKIGTKLMNMIEEKAKELGLHSIGLGTVEFQAKDFYEKLGYHVELIKENEPKGFKSYKMKKKV